MSRGSSRGYIKVGLAGVLLCAAGGLLSASHAAQYTTATVADLSLNGNLGTVVNGTTNYAISGGTIKTGVSETNLFHSFQSFGVPSGGSADFIVPNNSIQNILSRVNGTMGSQINGTLTSTISGVLPPNNISSANLWLINPNGIMFGPGAQLNVGGSFHATTADYIKLGTDGIFFANPDPTLGRTDILTMSPPSAFGFLSSNPAAIDVQTGGIDFATLQVPMSVPVGQTLSLVGGELNLGAADGSAPSHILAPGGTVNLVSVASAGEATFNGPINANGFTDLGNINIRGGSIIDGKNVFIRGGRLVMGAPADPTDPSSPILPGTISPGIFSLLGVGPPLDGGEVNIKVTKDVNIVGTVPDPVLGLHGGISAISALLAPGNLPNVTIDAGGSVSISGFTGVVLQRFGPGPAHPLDPPAQVVINAGDTVTLEKGGTIGLLNFYEGSGGNILMNARDININGDGSAGPTGTTGIIAQGLINPSAACFCDPAATFADSASIALNASGTLRVTGDGLISTTSAGYGRSNDITINAHDVFLSGRPAHINANSVFAGPSGNITINASGRVDILDGFVIFADTNGTGAGGTVNITAGQTVNIEGEASGIATQSGPPSQAALDFFAQNVFFVPDYAALLASFGLPPDTNTFQLLAFLEASGFTVLREPLVAGKGGAISVKTPILTVSGHNAAIDSGTGWDGNAGQVDINVGSAIVGDGGQIRSRSGLFEIGTGKLLLGTGNAGDVTVTATDPNTLMISGQDSAISTTTFGDGNAGNIFLSANQVYIQNGGSVSSASGGTVNGQLFAGTGLAGNVNITAGSLFRMLNGSITTQAVVADGGNISITTTGSTLLLANSQITTSVQSGVGQGGNITIGSLGHPFDFILLGDSQIRADAFGGPGGNINIFANVYLTSASVVSASSALSTPGTIAIEATVTDVSGSLTQLPTTPLEAAALMRASCAARLAGGKASSLVVAGREGQPLDPSSLLPSPLVVEAPVAALAPDEEFPWVRNLLRVSYLSLDPKCLP